jgi:hypothetical protein
MSESIKSSCPSFCAISGAIRVGYAQDLWLPYHLYSSRILTVLAAGLHCQALKWPPKLRSS